MILTIDLGTSATKVAVWDQGGLVAAGRAGLESDFGPGNRVEQDPRSWWASVVSACASARAAAPEAFAAVGVVGFSAARQTFVPTTAAGEPLGAALLWSDRRAVEEAHTLARSCGGPAELKGRTGVVLDAGSVAAKVAWLAAHDPERLAASRWLLSPRDLVVWHLTGEVCTDVTLASATGLYDLHGWSNGDASPVGGVVGEWNSSVVEELADAAAGRLPAIRPSTTVAGELRHGPARELGLPSAVPVVIGAGDRPCEVLGAGASAQCPMVSWGTTANVSIPVSVLPDLPPAGLIVTKGALGGWLLEGGLSAAGSAVEWLAALMGVDGDALMEMALTSPPGSNGAMAFAWLGGARAPWWRADVGASFAGLAPHHLPADVARAVVESVAWDVARCLDEAAPGASAAATGATGRKALMLGGGGARVPAWVEVLTAVTGLPARCRRSGEAASAGAALLAAGAIGVELDLDKFDPVVAQTLPDEQDAVVYREIRPRIDAAAARALELGGDGTGGADEAQRHGR